MSDEQHPRDGQFNLRTTAPERDRLKWLSQHYSISESSVIRMLIKQDHDRLTEMVRSRRSKRP